MLKIGIFKTDSLLMSWDRPRSGTSATVSKIPSSRVTNGLLGATGRPLFPACMIVVWTRRATASAAKAANLSFLIIFIGSVFLFCLFLWLLRKAGLQTEFQVRHAVIPL